MFLSPIYRSISSHENLPLLPICEKELNCLVAPHFLKLLKFENARKPKGDTMRHQKAPLSRRTVRSASYCARIGRPGERLCGVLRAKWDLQ